MTPIEKAAQEAANELYMSYNFDNRDEALSIITKHLAPIQAELDEKDAENKALRQIISDSVKALKSGVVAPDASLDFMQEVPKEVGLVVDGKDKLIQDARYFVEHYNKFTAACMCEIDEKPCNACKAADWLARVKE